MNRKGIIGLGPLLFFVPLVSLLVAAVSILLGLGLVGGLVFNKSVWRDKTFYARVLIVVLLVLAVMTLVHYFVGPSGNLMLGMLIGTVFFALILILLSINSFKEDRTHATKTVFLLTFLFLVVSELSVILVRAL